MPSPDKAEFIATKAQRHKAKVFDNRSEVQGLMQCRNPGPLGFEILKSLFPEPRILQQQGKSLLSTTDN